MANCYDVLLCLPYWKGPDLIVGQCRCALLKSTETCTVFHKIFFVPSVMHNTECLCTVGILKLQGDWN